MSIQPAKPSKTKKATSLLKALRMHPTNVAVDHAMIQNLRDFEETFNYFFEKGTAGERFVSPEAFDKIIAGAGHKLLFSLSFS